MPCCAEHPCRIGLRAAVRLFQFRAHKNYR